MSYDGLEMSDPRVAAGLAALRKGGSLNVYAKQPVLRVWYVYPDDAERAGLKHGEIVSRFDSGHDKTYKVVVTE